MGKQQSRFGIASVFLSLLILIFTILVFLIYISGINIRLFEIIRNVQIETMCFSTMVLSGIAFGLGIIGLFEKNRYKIFAIIGIGYSILFILIEILLYFSMQDLSHITL